MKSLTKILLALMIPILFILFISIAGNQTQAGTAMSGNMKKNIYDPTGVRMNIFDRNNHTGSLLSTVISDFTTQVNNILTGTGLLKSNNLSDLESIGTSRNNLGLGTGSNVEFQNITGSTIYGNTISLNGNELTDFEFAFLYGQDQSTAIDQPVQFGHITGATIVGTSYSIGGNTLDSSEFSLLDGITGVPLNSSDLNSFTGSSNINNVGTIGTGTWQGSLIEDSYISSASTWNAKQDDVGTGSNNESLTMSGSSIVWKEINQNHNLLTGILGSSYPDYYHIDFGQYQAVGTMTTNQLHFLTAGEVNQLKNIGTNTISSDVWSYLNDLDQPVDTASSVDFGGLTTTSTITTPDINTDIIAEKTSGSGITIDGLQIRDKDIENLRTATFDSVYYNGIITGTGVSIDLGNGNNQKVIFSGSTVDLSLTAPKGVGTFKIIITQGSNGGGILGTGGTAIKYPGGTTPVLSSTGGYIDILSIFYDGNTYYGVNTNDFQ